VCPRGAEFNAPLPVFGMALGSHLERSCREIASVMEDCVNALLEYGMEEEVCSTATLPRRITHLTLTHQLTTAIYTGCLLFAYCFCSFFSTMATMLVCMLGGRLIGLTVGALSSGLLEELSMKVDQNFPSKTFIIPIVFCTTCCLCHLLELFS